MRSVIGGISVVVFLLLLQGCYKTNVFDEPPDHPVIDSIAPATGKTGTQVRLYGTGFSIVSHGNSVRVNGVSVRVDSPSTSTVVLATITAVTGTGHVNITVNGKEAEGPIFTYDENAVAINSISPAAGWADTVVTIRGAGFGASADAAKVSFGGHVAAIRKFSDTLIVVSAPDGAPGTVMVTVTINGRVSNGVPFLYSQKPVITGVAVRQWNQGFYYWVAATGLATPNSANKITANGHDVHVDTVFRQGTGEYNQAPVGEKMAIKQDEVDKYNSAGLVDFVAIANGLAGDVYHYQNDPLITNLTAPKHDPYRFGRGDTVTITGKYFGSLQQQSAVEIWKDNAKLDPDPSVISWSNTQIKIKVPYGSYDLNSQTPLTVYVRQGDKYGRADVIYENLNDGAGQLAFWNTELLSGPRILMAAAAAGNKIVIAGGANTGVGAYGTAEIYDVNADTWTVVQLSVGRAKLAGAGTGNKILIGGGVEVTGALSARVDIYDVSTGAWSTSALSAARYNLAAAAAGNKIAFAGGVDANGYSAKVDIYDVNSGTWSAAQLSEARSGLVAAAAGSKIVFAAGSNTAGNPSKAVDIYDVSTNTWTTAQLSEEKTDLAAAGAGNKILFAGGQAVGPITNSVDIYDVSTGAWTTARLSAARSGLAGAGIGNKIAFAGGLSWTAQEFDVVDIYDINTNAWTTAKLSEPRTALVGAAAGNKLLFAAGTKSVVGTYVNSKTVDIYSLSP